MHLNATISDQENQIRQLRVNLSSSESTLNATKANSNNLELRVS
jgi:hypothetical protein